MRSFLLGLALVALAACASAPVYQPAAGDGPGYSEVRIERDRYRVTYRGPSGADASAVEDLALLRAADITKAQGFEWFVVDARRTEGGRSGARPSGGVSIAGGSGGYSGVGVGLGISLGGGAPSTTVLEIRMGQGPKPDGAYDAASVASQIRARTAPAQ